VRVLQISSAESMGGGERHLADLVGGLIDREHDLQVVLRPNSRLIEVLAPAQPAISTLPLRNAFDVFKRSPAGHPGFTESDRYHPRTHGPRTILWQAYALRQNPAAKLIVTRHVLFPLNRLQRLVLSNAARVIAVSEAVARVLRAQALVPAERIRVVPTVSTLSVLQQARAQFDAGAFRTRWNLPHDRPLIGSVGELRR